MAILGIRILPPFAIGRFGSSETPVEAYELESVKESPLDFRRIVGRETLVIDKSSGCIIQSYVPKGEQIVFKDGNRVRPVAPFLEIFALTNNDTLEPLTLDLLALEGLTLEDLNWSANVANFKIFRQTANDDDKIIAEIDPFNDNSVHELRGYCNNFLKEKYISFGELQFIKASENFPEVRLRFTPAHGIVYGSSKTRFNLEKNKLERDPIFIGKEDRIVYDIDKGKWLGFKADSNSPTLPNPSDIYQGYWPTEEPLPIGWGYIDDVCDGYIKFQLKLKDNSVLSSSARISSCMPAFAPDSQPMRTVADELEQLILGPEIEDEEVSLEEAGDIVLRALETIRLMNTRVMNANIIDGRSNIASTLYRQDSNDYGRNYSPGMASSIVDNLSVRMLHERIYTALMSGTAPWFAEVLRKPEEVGDLSEKARRKMPAMLRGADGRALTLTRRQISKIVKAVTGSLFK